MSTKTQMSLKMKININMQMNMDKDRDKDRAGSWTSEFSITQSNQLWNCLTEPISSVWHSSIYSKDHDCNVRVRVLYRLVPYGGSTLNTSNFNWSSTTELDFFWDISTVALLHGARLHCTVCVQLNHDILNRSYDDRFARLCYVTHPRKAKSIVLKTLKLVYTSLVMMSL
jgi:hypothetical protein